MNCPYCGHSEDKVIDSREVNDGIRRRRQCLGCSARFTTYERLQPASLFVIKKDERREEFDREKLLSGIRKACEKRPLLYQLGKAEIASTVVGDIVMERLKNLDHIAYIRFASVYREFADITALKQEVDTLLDAEAEPSTPSSQLPLLPDEELVGMDKNRRRKRT
jgi:transcriptional repressor NrdR